MATGETRRAGAVFSAEALTEALRTAQQAEEKAEKGVPFAFYNEHHLHYVLGRALETKVRARVVLEARPPGKSGEYCDLYGEWPDHSLWVEVKRGWHGSFSNAPTAWNSKPREQLKSWLHDIKRLLSIKEPGARRAFVLAHVREGSLVRRQTDELDPGIVTDIVDALKNERDFMTHVPKGLRAWIAPDLLVQVLRALSMDVSDTTPSPGEAKYESDELFYRYIAAIF